MAINGSELMKGNLLLLNNPQHRPNDTGKIVYVNEILEESASVFVLADLPAAFIFGQFYKYLDPIPLTEEILSKCQDFGPLDNNGEQSYFNGDDIIIRVKDMAIFAHSELDGSVMWLKRLLFVHHLQNLYQCLTGEELKIIF